MSNIPRSENNMIVNGIVQDTQSGIIPTTNHVTPIQHYPSQYMAPNYMYGYPAYQTTNFPGCSGMYIPQYQQNYPVGPQNFYGGTTNGYHSSMTTSYGLTQPNNIQYQTQGLAQNPTTTAQKIYLNQSTIISKPVLNASYKNSATSHEPKSSSDILSLGTANKTSTDSNLKSDNDKNSLDIENFKKEFLNFNGRKYGWEVLLKKEERECVEKMLKETIDFEIHYNNFENDFNKMKTASPNNEGILAEWMSWKSKLLERRNECKLQIQEKMDKLYKKICQDFPLFATTGKLPTDNFTVDSKKDDYQKQPQQLEKVKVELEENTGKSDHLKNKSLLTTNVVLDQSKHEKKIEEQSAEKRSTTTTTSNNNKNNIENETIQADKSNQKELATQMGDSNKNTNLRLQKALENQEDFRNTILSYMDPTLTKQWNDFQFLRNEMMFIDKTVTITRKHLKHIERDVKKPSPLNEKKELIKKSPLISSPNSKSLLPLSQSYSSPLLPFPALLKKPKVVEETQTIKIQVTNHGRKVKEMSMDIDSKAKSKISDPMTMESAKDQQRSNNIEVPICNDIGPKKNAKSKGENSRSSHRVLTQPKITSDTSLNSRIHSSRDSNSPSYFESTYYNNECSENQISNYDSYGSSCPDNDRSIANDINLFIERERRSLTENQQKKLSYTDPNFFTLPRKYNEEPLYIKDLLDFPSRAYRPTKIVFIIRGLPGSGKSYLSKLIKEREEKNNSLVKSRLLSLDDYFLVERENEMDTRGSRSMPTMVYEYDPIKEDEYKHYLFKEFRKITTNGYYNFIILDSVNSTINEVRNFYICAIENKYTPYVIEMEAIVRRLLNDCINSEEIIAHCYKHNRHGRSLSEIRLLYEKWELLPFDFLRVDASSLIVNYCSNASNNPRNSLPSISYPDKNSWIYSPQTSSSRIDIENSPDYLRHFHPESKFQNDYPEKRARLSLDNEMIPQRHEQRFMNTHLPGTPYSDSQHLSLPPSRFNDQRNPKYSPHSYYRH